MIVPRLHVPRLSRTQLISGVLLGMGAVIALRLGQLMLFEHQALAAMAKAQIEDEVRIPGPRGDIVDRNGVLLATSVPVRVLAIEPHRIAPAGLAALERATGSDEIVAHAKKRWWIACRECGDDVFQAVQALPKALGRDAAKKDLLPADALHWETGFKRVYPHGATAAHVLGYISLDEASAEGVEKSYNDLLRSGQTKILRATDARGRPLASVSERPVAQASSSLMLTIDLRIQEKLEESLAKAREEHAAKSAQGIVVDPANGEILALASVPNYDPNAYGKAEAAARRNPAIEYAFEPGSVMKPLTACGLAEKNLVGPFETVYCENGHWARDGRVMHDTHPYGSLTISEVIAVSSNIGIVKFSQRMDPQTLWETLTGLGLGLKTGIDLPYESRGRLANFKKWGKTDKDRIAFGHTVMVTPMQLAMAYATIAHGGVRVRPHVMLRTGSPDGGWYPPEKDPAQPRQVLSPRAAAQVALWMLGVVEAQHATGHRAAVDGYRVAGKTGTAEKITNGHYDRGKNIGTFAGFAPLANPAAVVVISLDEPSEGGHTGGAVAAPAFSEVMGETLRLLRIPPDYVPELPEEARPRQAAAPSRPRTAPLRAGDRPNPSSEPAQTERTGVAAAAIRPVPASAIISTGAKKDGKRG